MSFLKRLLILFSAVALLSCPFLTSVTVADHTTAATPSPHAGGGYLSRSIEDVPALATVESGLTPALAKISQAPLAKDKSLPAAYRSDDYGYITPAKNQYDTNSCWAFSAAACAEADAIKNHGFPADTDFSEWGMAYFMFHGSTDPLGLLAGDYMSLTGNYIMTSSSLLLLSQSLSNWKGVHYESQAPFDDLMENRDAILPADLCYNDVLHLEHTSILPNDTATDRAAVKQAIYSLGAVSSGLYYDDRFFDSLTSAYCNNQIADANHAITLIGWDDNYSRFNFLSSARPAKDGAWLVKNSWGTDYAQDGLFWVSYADLGIRSEAVTALDFAPATNYDRNYQYDGVPGFATLNYSDGSAAIAAVFTAADNEFLKAGSLFHYAEAPTAYTMDVYVGLSKADDPTSGKKVATASGTFATSGLYTVPLSTSVELQKGDSFSVVFTMSCTKSIHAMLAHPNETLFNDGSLISHNAGAIGQGFYLNKSVWNDLYVDHQASLRIHAYTAMEPDSPTTTTPTTATPTKKPTTAPPTTTTTEPTTIPTTKPTADPTGEPAMTAFLLWGDANGDELVNMKDVLLLRKYMAGMAVSLFVRNADVTGDSSLNMKDVLLLRKFLAGFPI